MRFAAHNASKPPPGLAWGSLPEAFQALITIITIEEILEHVDDIVKRHLSAMTTPTVTIKERILGSRKVCKLFINYISYIRYNGSCRFGRGDGIFVENDGESQTVSGAEQVYVAIEGRRKSEGEGRGRSVSYGLDK